MKKSKLPFIIIIGIILIGIDYYYFYIYKKEDVNSIDNTDEIKESNNNYECPSGYICEKDETGVYYNFIDNKSIKVNNVYNYDTQELEAGTLTINEEGILNFINLKGETIKKYNYIEEKIKSILIEETCEYKYISLLTVDGHVYVTDDIEHVLLDEPFILIEDVSNVTHILMVSKNNCEKGSLIGLTNDNKIIDIN